MIGDDLTYTTELPDGVTKTHELLAVINEMDHVKGHIWLEMQEKKVRVLRTTAGIKRSPDRILLHPEVNQQLGFKANANLMQEQTAERSPNEHFGVANQIFVYCDIVELQFIGDTMAPLMRIVHVAKDKYVYGQYMVVSFENPHYIPLLKQEFETIDIDLRDHTGDKIAFEGGTSCVKLHFRRQQSP